MVWKRWILSGASALALLSPTVLLAQADAPSRDLAETRTAQPAFQGAPISLTLKKAIELALQNSRDIQAAKLQTRVAGDVANVTRAEFRPNFYIGSGAGYTYGIPATPGGQAPSVFNSTYTQQLFNEPLRGLEHEQEEQARAQRFALEQTRELVLMRTASAYLELVKVRSSLEVLRKKKTARRRFWRSPSSAKAKALSCRWRLHAPSLCAHKSCNAFCNWRDDRTSWKYSCATSLDCRQNSRWS